MKQKGLAPIVIVILIAALAVGGYLLYSQQAKPTAQPSDLAPSTNPTSSSAAKTANWKTFKMTSVYGFGYEIKLPSGWDSMPFPWTEGAQPLPKELAQSFFDKGCGVNDGRIVILHFISSNPQSDVEKATNGLKKDGFTSSTIHTEAGVNVEKLTGNLISKTDYYAYFPSAKGYYYVSGRDECVANYGNTFDQILSTFKFLP